MAVLTALAVLALGQEAFGMRTELGSFTGAKVQIILMAPDDRLDPPKQSPKEGWMFEWLVNGYGRQPDGNLGLRTRVFSQERKDEGDRTPMVARTIMRLWDFNIQKLKIDHAEAYNNRTLDVYLTWGGKAGGEQLFDEDVEGGKRRKVNTIYIFDLNSFTDPVEMVREVAHEYGHATLPPIGGFGEPEDWGNGYLGEKMYLRWFRDAIAQSKLAERDAMGAPLDRLKAWVAANVDPLPKAVAELGPRKSLLKQGGAAAMDVWMGAVLYADSWLPVNVLGRSIKLTGSYKAVDYPDALVAAVEESGPFSIPAMLGEGQPFWVPVGTSKIGGGDVLQKAAGWAKVRPKGGAVQIVPPGP